MEKAITIKPRPFREQQDLEAMRAILVEGRKAGIDAYYVHVGDLNWWLFYLNLDNDWYQTIYLWEKGYDGRTVGWTLLSPQYCAFDVFAHPEEVVSGTRQDMFVWSEEQMGRASAGQGENSLRTMWVSEKDAALIEHLEERGFVRSNEHMVSMVRPLDEAIFELELAGGYRVRHVKGEGEVEKRAAASHAAFAPGKPLTVYVEQYRRFMRSSIYTPQLDLVVEAPDGQFAAFAICWLDSVNLVGHFEPVGTHPDFRRKGMGKAVLLEGLRQMKDRGMTTASVCVEGQNAGAQRLYESVGFRAVCKIHTYAREP